MAPLLNMADMLGTYRVLPTHASNAMRQMAASTNNRMDPATVCELYGSGNLRAAANIYGHRGVDGLSVVDMRDVRAEAEHWDVARAKH